MEASCFLSQVKYISERVIVILQKIKISHDSYIIIFNDNGVEGVGNGDRVTASVCLFNHKNEVRVILRMYTFKEMYEKGRFFINIPEDSPCAATSWQQTRRIWDT